MSLDLLQALVKLQECNNSIASQHSRKVFQAKTGLDLLKSISPSDLTKRKEKGKFTWLTGQIPNGLSSTYKRPSSPVNYRVIAVDGSQIDVSRHAPLRYNLINIGRAILQYGQDSSAILESYPELAVSEGELFIQDKDSTRTVAIEGPVLGIKRSLRELESLSESLVETKDGTPTLALLDGTLIYWSITANSLPIHIIEYFTKNHLIPALDKIRKKSLSNQMSLASYISLPRATDITNILRLAVCPYSPINCDKHCKNLANSQRPCDSVGSITDQDIFSLLLETGERSEVFYSNSQVIQNYYSDHEIGFFYLNTGQEIARVEVPHWIANNCSLMNLTHSVILDQVDKGLGYPVSLSEAHEQAVVTPQNRAAFNSMIETVLNDQHIPTGGSQKSTSKQLRWI